MNTSYFARLKEIPLHRRVAISRSVPKWYEGRRYMPLAPTWEVVQLAKAGKEKEYTDLYFDLLHKLNPEQVVNDLGTDTVLLCWEKPGEFCHRRMVAIWIETWTGIHVPELE